MKISRLATGLLAVALLAFLSTDVKAQDGKGKRDRPKDRGGEREGGERPDRRGDRPDGGGFRGGAGGFRGGVGGGGSPELGLLRIEEVRTEIELMPDQEEALKKLGEKRQQRDRPDFDFRNASDEDRTAFFEKMRKQRDEQMAKSREQLEEVLLPEQIERLDQIAMQQRGVGALMDPKIAEKLKITEEQQKELKEVTEGVRGTMRERMQEIFQSGDREQMRDKMRDEIGKIREEINEKVLDVLTSEQRKQFDEMKGEAFEIPESARRGGPGGRGEAGGRGGPGGRGEAGGRGGPGGRGGEAGGRGGPGGRGGEAGGRGGRGGQRGDREGGDRPRRPERPEADADDEV